MADDGKTYDVTCPHCRKPFSAQSIGEARHQGFKCPHCKLFVPIERGDEQLVEPGAPAA